MDSSLATPSLSLYKVSSTAGLERRKLFTSVHAGEMVNMPTAIGIATETASRVSSIEMSIVEGI